MREAYQRIGPGPNIEGEFGPGPSRRVRQSVRVTAPSCRLADYSALTSINSKFCTQYRAFS
ncbi:hypothetical protein MTBUT4_160061 [Magnetospirillum sp. UT-4]|nr:hypothetical protein MTBUT4_160061 [Magnetospirillum sp. UT-4]